MSETDYINFMWKVAVYVLMPAAIILCVLSFIASVIIAIAGLA